MGSPEMTAFDITGIRVGDGLEGEESSEVITQFRYSEDGGGDLYIGKEELIYLIRTTENCTVHAVSIHGHRTRVVVVKPSDPAREHFLRTVGDRRADNDLMSLPRF